MFSKSVELGGRKGHPTFGIRERRVKEVTVETDGVTILFSHIYTKTSLKGVHPTNSYPPGDI